MKEIYEIENEIENAKNLLKQEEFLKKRISIYCGNKLYVIVTRNKTAFSVRCNIDGKDTKKIIGYYPNMTVGAAIIKAVESTDQENISKKSKHCITMPDIPTFGQYKKRFLESKMPKRIKTAKSNKTPSRHNNLSCNLNHINELNNTKLNMITFLQIHKILSKKDDLSPNVKVLVIRAVNSCLNAAESDGYGINPIRNCLSGNGTLAQGYALPESKGYAFQPAELFKQNVLDCLTRGEHKMLYIILLECLLGLRKNELTSLEWSWIDFDSMLITMPKETMKMNREFVIPITAFTKSALLGWKKESEENKKLGRFLFPLKTSIKRKMNSRDINAFWNARIDVKLCTFHGIRKTITTYLSSIGIPDDVADKIISHDGRTRVARIYNHNDYKKQKLKALKIWHYFLYKNLPTELKALFLDLDYSDIRICMREYVKQILRGGF